MAEIVAATAAIVQFVDVAVRLSCGLGRFCSEVRHVPRHFHRLLEDVRQQVKVAQRIQTHYLPAFATSTASSTFDDPLVEYIILAEELCKTLDTLLANKNDGILKQRWSSLCSIRKKEEVLQICSRLEQRKSTLSMWMDAVNLHLSSDINTTASLIKHGIEENLTLAKEVKDTSSKTIAGTEQLLPQVQKINQAMTTSSEQTEQIMKDIQKLNAQAAQFLANTDVFIQQSRPADQESSRISSNIQLILQKLDSISVGSGKARSSAQSDTVACDSSVEVVRQPHYGGTDRSLDSKNVAIITGNDSPADSTSNSLLGQIAETNYLEQLGRLEQSYFSFTRKYGDDVNDGAHVGSRVGCTCRTVTRARTWSPLSILRFTQTFRTQHLSFCPEYRNSEQSLDFAMQFLTPHWLLLYAINVGFQLRNWWTTKTFSICPIVIGTTRLVDSKVSPAFRAVLDTKEQLHDTGLHHIYIPKLQDTLQDLFEKQLASALDTDHNGRTLLNEVLWIYNSHFSRGLETNDEYVSLTQFLLNKGADPNTISSSAAMEVSDRYGDVGGTTLDQFGKSLLGLSGSCFYHKLSTAMKLRNLTIFKRLVAAGSEFSKPLNSMATVHPYYLCALFLDEVQEFTYLEDQIDICQLGDWVPILLQQRENQFQRAINKAKLADLNRSSPINGLAPAHFAVLWHSGLKGLIEKGIDVNVEDCYGRRPIHLAVVLGLTTSVEYLINADCALFSPPHSHSLLQNALKLRGPQRKQILSLLISALIDRHKRLLDMAKELLPNSCISKLKLVEGQVKERNAPWIYETLISYGIDVPEALELDGRSFYNFADMDGDIDLTPDVAVAFWDAGFEEINEPNQSGLTPLLQSFFYAKFEMVAWFVEKGMSLSSTHRDAPLTALHLYAKRIDYLGAVFSADLDALPTQKHYIARIQEVIGIPHDECNCLCSPDGCTPVKFLSEDRLQGGSRKANFRNWLESTEPDKTLLQQYVREFTRCLLFNYLDGKHTCCSLDNGCSLGKRRFNSLRPKSRIQDKLGIDLAKRAKRMMEHHSYCVDGIPIPREDATFLREDAESVKMALGDLMSHYDEMPRPDTMPAEEQPFQYINWILAKGYLLLDVDFVCSHLSGGQTLYGIFS